MVVKLPLYDFYPEVSPFKTENFTVKDPTIEDEDRLFNPDRIKGGYALDDFVRGLLPEEAQRQYGNMFLIDRNFILYAVRVAMFGDTIEFRENSECSHCGASLREATIDSEVFIPENRKFEMKEGGYSIRFKLLTVSDQNIMRKDPLMKSNFLTRMLYYVIDTIEKEGNDITDKYALIRSIPISLGTKIREFLNTQYPRFDIFIKCSSCENTIPFEMNESFFWNKL